MFHGSAKRAVDEIMILMSMKCPRRLRCSLNVAGSIFKRTVFHFLGDGEYMQTQPVFVGPISLLKLITQFYSHANSKRATLKCLKGNDSVSKLLPFQ